MVGVGHLVVEVPQEVEAVAVEPAHRVREGQVVPLATGVPQVAAGVGALREPACQGLSNCCQQYIITLTRTEEVGGEKQTRIQ